MHITDILNRFEKQVGKCNSLGLYKNEIMETILHLEFRSLWSFSTCARTRRVLKFVYQSNANKMGWVWPLSKKHFLKRMMNTSKTVSVFGWITSLNATIVQPSKRLDNKWILMIGTLLLIWNFFIVLYLTQISMSMFWLMIYMQI